MKKSFALGLAAGVFGNIAAVAMDGPFEPLPDVPDYVATLVMKHGWGSSQSEGQTIVHHAGWSRIENEIEGRYQLTSYVSAAVPVSVKIYRSPGVNSLTIVHGEDTRTPGWDYNAFTTREHETVAGESCEVWNAARHQVQGAGNNQVELKKLSCVTSDGIELWWRYVTSSGSTGMSAEVTRIERRPVEDDEVAIPRDLLELTRWVKPDDTPALDATAAPDATVVLEALQLEGAGNAVAKRVTRRHGGWLANNETFSNGGSRLSIENIQQGFSLSVQRGSNGRLRTLVMRNQEAQSEAPGRLKPVKSERTETVLGETCTWFNMMPGVADVGLMQCQTEDGLVLKEQASRRGAPFGMRAAVSIERAPVALADVLPPPEILMRNNWGIQD
jgi:hypothetical protein